jgi:hypothetical protein
MTPDLAEYDPLDRAHQHDPYPFFRQAHESCPIHHHVLPEGERAPDTVHENPLLGRPVDHFYTVFGYEDVRDVLGNHEVFSSRQGPGPERLVAPNGTGVLLYADEPLHRLHRQIVNKAFTPRTVSQIEPRIREIVEGIVERLAPQGGAEMVREFAVAIPGQVFAEMFGVPPEDTAKFKRWADEIVSAFGGDPESQARSVETLQEVAVYFMAMFTERRPLPDPERRRGDAAVGEPHPATVPHAARRHVGGRLPDQGRRQGERHVRGRQPRPEDVLEPRRVRHPPRPQGPAQARGVRVRHPRLRRVRPRTRRTPDRDRDPAGPDRLLAVGSCSSTGTRWQPDRAHPRTAAHPLGGLKSSASTDYDVAV